MFSTVEDNTARAASVGAAATLSATDSVGLDYLNR